MWISKLLKFDFLQNKKSFWSEIRNIFPSFTSGLFFKLEKRTSNNIAGITFKPWSKQVSARKLEIDDPRLPRKRKVSNHYEEGETPVKFVSTFEEHSRQVLYQAIDMAVNCIRDRFQKKDYIEPLQAMGMLLLKALREKDFGHELQQISSFFRSDLDKFKLETQLKTLTHIVDEKQVVIKVSEVVKLVKLILLVPTTNAVGERPCLPLLKVKT